MSPNGNVSLIPDVRFGAVLREKKLARTPAEIRNKKTQRHKTRGNNLEAAITDHSNAAEWTVTGAVFLYAANGVGGDPGTQQRWHFYATTYR